jgi:hypothetical protein
LDIGFLTVDGLPLETIPMNATTSAQAVGPLTFDISRNIVTYGNGTQGISGFTFYSVSPSFAVDAIDMGVTAVYMNGFFYTNHEDPNPSSSNLQFIDPLNTSFPPVYSAGGGATTIGGYSGTNLAYQVTLPEPGVAEGHWCATFVRNVSGVLEAGTATIGYCP